MVWVVSILGKFSPGQLTGSIMTSNLTRPGTALYLVFLLSYGVTFPTPSLGQQVSIQAIPTLSGQAEDRLRIAQLLGRLTTEGYLFRTPSRLLRRILEDDANWSITLLAPEIRGIQNSDLPFSFNDGPLWAGRGWNRLITIGARTQLGPITLVLAPQFIYQENKAFHFIPYPLDATPERSLHANPFHPAPQSMDYPIRFGEESLDEIDWGQSSISIDAGPLALGLSTENTWWGPGLRNGILMSNQAAGIPRVFVRTNEPIRTKLGAFEGLWMLGRLQESNFFDLDDSNDYRTLNGIVLTFQPSFDPGLTIGIARTVFASSIEGSSSWKNALNVLKSVGTPNRLDLSTENQLGRDQISVLFGRWVFAPHGVEIYGEWARFEEPTSFRDFLEFPQHSSGYTTGFQWVQASNRDARLRIQAEITNLEPSSTFLHRKPFSSYASSVVPHGYTHKGQVLGSGIGPGASSQWLAMDRLASTWNAGVFAGRIRWDSTAWLTSAVKRWGREDVSLFWGARGGVEVSGWGLFMDISHGVRINYLFQTFIPDPVSGRSEGVDVANTSISVTLAKSLWR